MNGLSDQAHSCNSPDSPLDASADAYPLSSPDYHKVMALAAMTREQIAVGLTTLDGEFGYLLETKGISERIRGAFGHLGIRRTAIFARRACR